jgi:nitrite reductase/ring-hydroxylating ferredoxin subunit
MERECLNRRELLRRSLAVAGVPVVCCTTAGVPPAALSYNGKLLVIDLNKVPELRRAGAAVRVVDLERRVNLIVVHGRKGRFAALERSCTHGGAQVAYNRVNDTVQCSSWGHSEFALDGALLGGSAKRPLPAHPCRVVRGTLEVTL